MLYTPYGYEGMEHTCIPQTPRDSQAKLVQYPLMFAAFVIRHTTMAHLWSILYNNMLICILFELASITQSIAWLHHNACKHPMHASLKNIPSA